MKLRTAALLGAAAIALCAVTEALNTSANAQEANTPQDRFSRQLASIWDQTPAVGQRLTQKLCENIDSGLIVPGMQDEDMLTVSGMTVSEINKLCRNLRQANLIPPAETLQDKAAVHNARVIREALAAQSPAPMTSEERRQARIEREAAADARAAFDRAAADGVIATGEMRTNQVGFVEKHGDLTDLTPTPPMTRMEVRELKLSAKMFD